MTAFRISKREIKQPSIGEILRNARIEKRLSYEEVESATKIRIKFVEAIESEKWQQLPKGPYVLGFLKSYALYLELPYKEIERNYKREINTKESLKKEKKIITEKKELRFPKIFITPTILATGLLAVIVIG